MFYAALWFVNLAYSLNRIDKERKQVTGRQRFGTCTVQHDKIIPFFLLLVHIHCTSLSQHVFALLLMFCFTSRHKAFVCITGATLGKQQTVTVTFEYITNKMNGYTCKRVNVFFLTEPWTGVLHLLAESQDYDYFSMFKSWFCFFCVCLNQSVSLFPALPDVPAVYVNIFVTKGKYVPTLISSINLYLSLCLGWLSLHYTLHLGTI